MISQKLSTSKADTAFQYGCMLKNNSIKKVVSYVKKEADCDHGVV